MEVNNSVMAHWAMREVGPYQRAQNKQELLHIGEDCVLNVNLRVKVAIPFIFIDIQRVKTSNSLLKIY